MRCIQVAACQPASNVVNVRQSCCAPSMLRLAPHVFELHKASVKLTTGLSTYQCTRLPKTSLRLNAGSSRYQQSTPICSFGGKGKSENDLTFSWKAIEKATGSLKKEQSLEDVLRQQIERKEYYQDGGSGGKPPGGGGGGSGGSEDEGLSGILDDFREVILATIGFIFLYICIIQGQEMTLLAKDYIKFLFGAQKSNRLRRTLFQWGRFFQRLTTKEVQPDWLELTLLNTSTWWDSPEKYKLILMSYLASRSYQ